MSIYQDESDAREHPAYNAGLQSAVKLAAADPANGCFSVYWDGKAIFVRGPTGAPPMNSVCVCVVQRWDNTTVQLRYGGARSEWVKV